MIAKMVMVQSLGGTQEYLERKCDNQGRKRAGIEISGTHTREEFSRLVDIVDSRGCPIEHHIFAYGAAVHGPITSRRANDIIQSFEQMAYAGLLIPPPSLKYRHYETGGGLHDHYLPQRFDFPSGKQFSLFPQPTDICLVQLWQTGENVHFGMPDPFDPAFCRDFPHLPYRLSSLVQLQVEKARELLREARTTGTVNDNRSGRDYLATVHQIQSHLRDGCLYLKDGEKWVQLTTQTFGQEKPMPLDPGALRPWFTLDDRELLRLAIKVRADGQRQQFPAIHFPADGIFELAHIGRYEQAQEETPRVETNPQTLADSPAELSRHFAELDDIIVEMRRRKPDAAAIRRGKELHAESARIIAAELTEWRERAGQLHFRFSRPTRAVAGPFSIQPEAGPDTPTPAAPGPAGTIAPAAPPPPPDQRHGGTDDDGGTMSDSIKPSNRSPLHTDLP